MLTANINGLGDIRADLVKYLGPIVGKTRVASTYDSAMETVRAEAGVGAKAAVKPMVIGAIVASTVAAGLGIAALVVSLTR